jgi:hypothetical protein|tara:strand:- start:111 stop:566 length:456 start_codon:yes stop_codon:yes gene_type:complete
MPDQVKEAVKAPVEDLNDGPKKKSTLTKIKNAILPDSAEQAAIVSTAVRLGVLVWSGGILTLNYVTVPGIPQQKIDPTFIASVFTGVLASFGIQTAKKSGDGTMKMNNNGSAPVSKADMEKMMEKASSSGTVQTIRVEQAPLVITTQPPVK